MRHAGTSYDDRERTPFAAVYTGSRLYYVTPRGEFVPLDEPSKYSDLWLTTMRDIVTVMDRTSVSVMSDIVDSLQAEVSRRTSDDPWLQRNQYGVWIEWDE